MAPMMGFGHLVRAATGSRVAAAPPEPEGYRNDAYRAPTPATLRGATALTGAGAHALWESKRAAFVDANQRQGFGHFFTGSSGILEREE